MKHIITKRRQSTTTFVLSLLSMLFMTAGCLEPDMPSNLISAGDASKVAGGWNAYLGSNSKIVWTHIDGTRQYASAPQDGILLSSVLTRKKRDIQSVDTIPSSITSIGEEAFQNCISLASITIPSSVTSIAEYAFSNCKSLSSVRVAAETPPDAIYSSSWAAFDDTHSSLCISVPNASVAAYTAADGWRDFADKICEGTIVWTHIDGTKQYADAPQDGILRWKTLTPTKTDIKSVDFIPKSVKRIGDSAFAYCSGLTSITIPKSVKSIGGWAFKGCNDIVRRSGEAFYNCSGLTSVTIEDGVESIGEGAFWNCRSLTSVTIPKSVTSIGKEAFSGCWRLTSVTIEAGMKSIGKEAFSGCWRLTSVTIEDGVESIGEGAFWNCRSLTSITIPNSVTSIGAGAFGYCAGLTSVEVKASTPPTAGGGMFERTALIIRVPDASVAAYRGANNWSAYASRIFGSYELVTVPKIEWIDIIKGKQESDAPTDGILFSSTLTATKTDIKSVNTIPSSVTSIGMSAFSNCTGLTRITIPSTVTSIGENAFESCTSLTSIAIPSSVTSIEAWTFSGCWGLTRITLPSSVTSIGYSAFSDCTGLMSVRVEATSPPTAGSYMFERTDPNLSITVPSASVDAYKRAEGWSEYASKISGY